MRAFQRADGGFHHLVIDADRAGGEAGHAQPLQHPGAHRLAGLGAEALDAAGVSSPERVVRSMSEIAFSSQAAW
jgi:acyl dehydratase